MFTKAIALLAAVAAVVPASMAVGDATIKNSCDKPLCVYTTAPGGGPVQKTFRLKPGASKKLNYPANGMTGSQIQVSPNCSTSNVVYFEIAQGNNIVYYDVNINGPTTNPFTDGFSVTGSDASCPKISCAKGGATACFNNPNGHPQNQVKACSSDNSITLRACKP